MKTQNSADVPIHPITLTPWKPKQGDPILLQVPIGWTDKDISAMATMFCCGDIAEVRWQHGHVKNPGAYDGNGHYVHR